jgi:hypothetical protein
VGFFKVIEKVFHASLFLKSGEQGFTGGRRLKQGFTGGRQCEKLAL